MTGLLAAWRWAKRWWGLAVGGLGLSVGAALDWGAYRRGVASAADALRVERARRGIANLQGRRAELQAQDEADEREVARIDKALEANRQAIVAARERANLPSEELAAAFRRHGY